MIYLRDLTRTDLPQTLIWRQDPALVAHLGEPFRFINAETETAWFDAYLTQRPQQVRLAICVQGSDRHIGNVQLLQIHPVHRSAEFSILIGEATARGQGMGLRASQLCLQHAFDDLNLHRIWLQVRSDNLPALKLYQRLGFVEEGRLRQAAFKQGQYVDLLIMGLLADEFRTAEA
jgi:diamine N-acetyltransferase